MKLILLPLVLLLTACTTVVPITQPWPEAPGLQSLQACPKLVQLEPDPKLSQVAKTVASNYSEYYICAVKLDAWQEWYKQQKLIYQGLK